MNNMIYVLVAFLSVSAGFFLGMLFITSVYVSGENRAVKKMEKENSPKIRKKRYKKELRRRKRLVKKEKRAQIRPSESMPSEIEWKGDAHQRAKYRISNLPDKSTSWARLNDHLDGIDDHAETLRRMREKEDAGYIYVGSLKKH